MSIAIVGAGFSGAVVARELALAGKQVEVFEARAHVAGNCHTQRDTDTQVMVHRYGPHIFHTNDDNVWRYVNSFDEFVPFVNRVKAVSNGRVYPLPINLLTINSFFGKAFNPREAADFIDALSDKTIANPDSFEEQALHLIGRDLYEAFFKGYTSKQWGKRPTELPASILKRLPVRFNYDDNYYESRYQGIPRHGYTCVVEKIINHPRIAVHLQSRFDKSMRKDFQHVFFSGPIDEWFEYDEGLLEYRTLDFAVERYAGDFQGNAVINYCDASVPWTRVTEHKHLAPWERHDLTVVYRETSRSAAENDSKYYPLRHSRNSTLISAYLARAAEEPATTFIGRLGTYRYLDMDATIAEALSAAARFLAA